MFYHLVIASLGNIIGNGDLPPWYEKESPQRYAEELTRDHTIIMGKKSYAEFGYRKYLSRKALAVSRKGLTLREAMTDTQDEEKVFICGGRSIFKETMPMIQGIYLVKMFRVYSGNVFYPTIPLDMKLKKVTSHPIDEHVALYYYERPWIHEN